MTRIIQALAILCSIIASTSGAKAAPRYDYCSLFNGRTTVFLIDRTDPYDEIDKEVLSAGVDSVLKSLEPGDRLVMQTITDDFATGHRLFEGCKPGCPEEGLLGGLLSTCRPSIARRDALTYQEDFAHAVLPLVQTIEDHNGSAILETFSAVAREYAGVARVRFLIFSDLVQNSKLGNFEKMGDGAFKALLAKVHQLEMTPQIQGDEVVVFGFARQQGANRRGLNPEQGMRVDRFWHAYFAQCGAQSVTISQRLSEAYR